MVSSFFYIHHLDDPTRVRDRDDAHDGDRDQVAFRRTCSFQT